MFNKPCKRSVWDKADVPSFLRFAITEWVYDDRMTDAEKKANPLFYVAGGYLKKIPYQEAFQEAWRKASVSDRKRVLALPNFDAAVFKDISGIDVEAV
ncbi:hypothetical protein [Mesorhizobium sp. B2-3-10]|uniref:hypothetical protein n=1 Tax=Mesorhizobium sp. B2-3-10 TaxID=2589954 RepID=UPI00112C377A|nr:hypothetical protein [Mesorhizobium sp. B2-3-10]TPL98305.1 hypothetical protein FJ943_15485 [Mesorhizobium sp. B2-3-10]